VYRRLESKSGIGKELVGTLKLDVQILFEICPCLFEMRTCEICFLNGREVTTSYSVIRSPILAVFQILFVFLVTGISIDKPFDPS